MSRPIYNYALAFIAVLSFTLAVALAFTYAPGPRFLLADETYTEVLPFFLTTVTVGLVGVIYAQYQNSVDVRREMMEKKADSLDARIDALRAFYADVLELFQTAKRARRRIRLLCGKNTDGGSYAMRFSDLLGIIDPLTTAELHAEQIVKRLTFEPDIVDGSGLPDGAERPSARLLGQIEALRRVLREVLRSAEWAGLSDAIADPAEWVHLPDPFIVFAQLADTVGPFGFNAVAANFDLFTEEVLAVIAALEADRPTVAPRERRGARA